MNPSQQATQAAGSGNSLQDKFEMSMVIVYNVATIVTLPVEYALRPFFGTTYFNPVVMALSFAMMVMLPLVGAILGGLTSMLSFGLASPAPSSGMISMGNLTFFYMIGNAIHGFRLWKRMINPLKEFSGEYEGPAWFFFRLLPKGSDYWPVRIVWEPLFLIVLSSVLGHMHILDSFASNYVAVAGFFLFFKEWISWYKSFLSLRMMLDTDARSRTLAKYINGEATDEDLAIIHKARPPKGTPQEVIDQEKARIASTLPPELQKLVTPIVSPNGRNPQEPFFAGHNPRAGFITLEANQMKLAVIALLLVGYFVLTHVRFSAPPAPPAKPSAFDGRVPARRFAHIPPEADSQDSPVSATGNPSEPANAMPPDSVPAAPVTHPNFSGIWQGNTMLPDKSLCTLKLEIRDVTSQPPSVWGYLTETCMPVGALAHDLHVNPTSLMTAMTKLPPVSSVLKGQWGDNAIQFTVDQNIGVPPGGCGMTSLKAYEFGTGQIAADWQKGACQSGQAVMKRLGR